MGFKPSKELGPPGRAQMYNLGCANGMEEAPAASRGEGGRKERVQQGGHVGAGLRRGEGALDVITQAAEGNYGLSDTWIQLPKSQESMLE